MRSYTGIVSSVYGGIGILDKIANNPAAIAAWEARASSAFGYNVTVFDQGFNASVGQPYMWVISDGASTSIPLSQSVGRDLSSRSQVRDAIRRVSGSNSTGALSSTPTGYPVPSFDEGVVVTELLYLAPARQYGVGLLTTINSGDDSRLVFIIFVLEAYLNPLLAISAGAVVTVMDHTGVWFSQGDCNAHDAVSELSRTATITTNATWTIKVGQ